MLLFVVDGSCFAPALLQRSAQSSLAVPMLPRAPFIICLVTADDVEMAVEKCENLWADALAARKKVEELSTEAEELAESSAALGEETSKVVDAAEKFKFSMVGDVKAASDAALDANAMLANAVEASEEAERLEGLAEAALVEMEAAIEQHLIDFPDSELRDELD